jgi:outer membrane protein OmpA-like peptidoglycan-associated protein
MYSRETGGDSIGRDIDIRTRSGLLTLSPRYKLTERWQLGPSVDMAFGTDTRQGPTVGTANSAVFGGLKAVYEMPLAERWLGRVFFQGSTDLSVSSRRLFMTMAGVQIGLPIRARPRAEIPEDRIRMSLSGPMRELKIVLDPQAVFFKTNSSQLKPKVQEAFREIADYLASNPAAWSALRIAGHADRRGKYNYNLALSKRRAGSVKEAMAVSGIEREKIVAEAFSFTKPVDRGSSRVSLAKNRRVELVFKDVADPETVKRKLEPLTRIAAMTFEDAVHER